jgi:adenosylcobinamide-GDP ribazoletransferase
MRSPGLLRRHLFAPVAFLTILPVPDAAHPWELGLASFPLVGLALGGVLVLVDALASHLWPPAVVAVVLVGLLVLLTGGLHLDGLADTVDGLVGGHDRDGRLAIMADPHPGTLGMVAVVIVLGLQVASLSTLDPSLRPQALVLGPALARWAALPLLAALPPARPTGLGALARRSLGAASLAAATMTAVAASLLLLGIRGLALLAVAGLIPLGLGLVARRTLGGLTGDVVGAGVELAETGVFLAVAALH